MRLGLIADTHGWLRPEVFEVFRDVDLILHAGDVGPPDLLTELQAVAPVTAVWGNTDGFELRGTLPELVESMALSLEPHALPYYALELATAFHDFYEKCRVLSDDEALSKARLKLVSAAKITLARALDLMGMTAPERM